jgi:hypothetical protein
VAADFEKDRSTIPEPGRRVPVSSGPTDIEDSTLQGSSQKGFPFGILFVVLLVAVVGGGIAAFLYHSGNSQESGQEQEADPALLDPKSKMELKTAIEKEAASAGLNSHSDSEKEITNLPSSGGTEEPAAPAESSPVEEEKKEPEAVAVTEEEKPAPPPLEREPREEAKSERKVVPSKPKPKKPKTAKRKKRHKKTVASAEPEEKGFGTLDVGVSGGWAFVYIDGAKIRTTPLLNYQIKAGKHKVELRDGEGRVVRRWNIRLRNSERVKLLHQ